MGLTMGQRQAVTVIKARAYARGGRPEKVRILDELVELTGWNRDRAACGRTGMSTTMPYFRAPFGSRWSRLTCGPSL
jgi:hypothetical protein